MDRPVLTLVLVLVAVPSVILHEISHGFFANVFGDDTAKRAGRLTLNPIPHIDLFGTILLPAMLAATSLGAFGYAKPVPVVPGRMRHPRRDALLVALAGPATNIVLAVVCALAFRALDPMSQYGAALSIDAGTFSWPMVVVLAGTVNAILAAFNALPIPPLDGSALVERVLPSAWLPQWYRFRQYSMVLVLLLVFVVPGGLSPVFNWATDRWFSIATA